jgi:hypothetical protein
MIDSRGGQQITAAISTRDISTSGVGFEADHRLRVGACCVICLRAGHVKRMILAQVTYINSPANGGMRYRYGARFIKIIPMESTTMSVPHAWFEDGHFDSRPV